MATVGAFPGFNELIRKTVRAATNPLDKSTVVSIYPKEINEVKHTIQPGYFHLDVGSLEKPAILVVGSSSWWKEIDSEQPLLEIPNSSIQVADSIVRDYCNGLLGCNMGSSMPGIFWVPGEFDLAQLKVKHKDKIEKAVTTQHRYWETLVRLADIGWARSDGNPLTISDDMRLAARMLGLSNKDWMRDFTMLQQIRCIACGNPRNPNYPVCPSCKAVDKDKAKELGIVFAS